MLRTPSVPARLPALLRCLVLVALGGGCVPEGDPLGTVQRRAVLDTASLDFGNVMPGVPTERAARLHNQGESTFQVTARITPEDSPFVLLQRTWTVDSAGASVPVQLLALGGAGALEATLVLETTDDEGRRFDVPLRAQVTGLPACNDFNPCTLDLWDGTACSYNPVNAACDDGSACTTADRCSNGQCVGQPLACDDGVACTSDACDPSAGCVHLPRAEACSDGDPCTADACVPGAGCSHAVAPNGTLCGPPACDAMPLCVSGQCTALPAPDGFPCEDGDPCTAGDACVSGTCRRGLGNAMGVSGPSVIAATTLDAADYEDPDDALGFLTLGDGRVKVAWLSAPGGLGCASSACAPTPGCNGTQGNLGSFGIHLSTVEADGTVSGVQEVGDQGWFSRVPLAARAVPMDDGLAILALYTGSLTACCTHETRCPHEPPSFLLWHVLREGGIWGPWTVETLAADEQPEVPAAFPLAISARGNTVAVVTGHPVQDASCSGACPRVVQVNTRLMTMEPNEPAGEPHTVDIPVNPTGALAVDARVLLTEDQLLLAVHEHTEAPSTDGLACVLPQPFRARTTLLRGARAEPLQLVETALPPSAENVLGVALGESPLGVATLVATQGAVEAADCACTAGNFCDCFCRVSPALHVHEAGVHATVELPQGVGGSSPVTQVTAATLFGRVMGVTLQQNGTLMMAASPLGLLPGVNAQLSVDPEWGLLPDVSRVPALVEDGAHAWMAVVVHRTLGRVPTRALAVVKAGCGVVAGAPIQWPADGGFPEAAPDAGNGG